MTNKTCQRDVNDFGWKVKKITLQWDERQMCKRFLKEKKYTGGHFE